MGKLKLEKKEVTCKTYGSSLYYVKVPGSISQEGNILVYADYVLVDNGSILFYSYNQYNEENDDLTLALGPGNWKYFYLAAEQGQYPLSVSRWKGVAEVRVIEKEKEVEKEVEKHEDVEMTAEEKEENNKTEEE